MGGDDNGVAGVIASSLLGRSRRWRTRKNKTGAMSPSCLREDDAREREKEEEEEAIIAKRASCVDSIAIIAARSERLTAPGLSLSFILAAETTNFPNGAANNSCSGRAGD